MVDFTLQAFDVDQGYDGNNLAPVLNSLIESADQSTVNLLW